MFLSMDKFTYSGDSVGPLLFVPKVREMVVVSPIAVPITRNIVVVELQSVFEWLRDARKTQTYLPMPGLTAAIVPCLK